ncbi:MAG: hypothetical protein MN733_13185 [Nitrososphaera sp.]|nr:hypothetical protein [Nitrososphaera sp.]
MISDEFGKQLHDRATRGETLSDEELAQLENWYVFQDQAENNSLSVANNEATLTTLQSQIEAALVQLTMTTKRIQETVAANETLRQENIALRRQLAKLSTTQQAT